MILLRLRDQGGMAEYIDYSTTMGSLMLFVFVLAMSVVLWNTGLLGGLRRYTEFSVRLALGEEKNHIYATLIYEGILIGTIGSVIGTDIGLSKSYYLQEVGVDIGGSMKNSTLMMPSVVRAAITPTAFYIGFFPVFFLWCQEMRWQESAFTNAKQPSFLKHSNNQNNYIPMKQLIIFLAACMIGYQANS